MEAIDPFDHQDEGHRAPDEDEGRATTPAPKPSTNTYLNALAVIAREDVEGLLKAEQSYGDSWKRRGGVGAFMMLARKWDRIENAMTTPVVLRPDEGHPAAADMVVDRYDIFARTIADGRAEGLIDDIRDLRRYLLLVEGELRARGLDLRHRDNQ